MSRDVVVPEGDGGAEESVSERESDARWVRTFNPSARIEAARSAMGVRMTDSRMSGNKASITPNFVKNRLRADRRVICLVTSESVPSRTRKSDVAVTELAVEDVRLRLLSLAGCVEAGVTGRGGDGSGTMLGAVPKVTGPREVEAARAAAGAGGAVEAEAEEPPGCAEAALAGSSKLLGLGQPAG